MSFFTFKDIAITGLASAVPEVPSRISLVSQTTSDLGYEAAVALLNKRNIDHSDIGCIIFISRTPDYRSPATAAVLHNRLKLSVDCIAYDMNMGGAGFVYGLQMGCSILNEINKTYSLIILGDTTSKQISKNNQLSDTMKDGASAILLEKKPNSPPIHINTQAFGTGFESFIHAEGGFRLPANKEITANAIHDNKSVLDKLAINEKEFYSFAINEMPVLIEKFISKLNTSLKHYDFVAIQQENEFVLRRISEKLNIPFSELPINYREFGNTSGNSVPLLIIDKLANENTREVKILACCFGEGFSSGVASFILDTSYIEPLIKTDNFYHDGTVSHIF